MISLIFPVYNEEEVLSELLNELNKVVPKIEKNYEYIFINDGSKDNTLNILKKFKEKDSHIKIVDFSRNFGHQMAVSAGLKHAKGDCAIIMDADLQDPPELLPQFIDKWKQGYEIVYGQRKERPGEAVIKRATARMFYKILSKISDVKVNENAGDFRLLDRKVVDEMLKMPELHRYLRGLSDSLGFNQIGIEFDRPVRRFGTPKYSLIKSSLLAWEGIVALSKKPLQLASFIGALIALFAFIYMLRIFYLRCFTDLIVPGWSSLMVAILFIGSIQLLCLGIIGDYIGRISEEVRKRPMYVVKKFYE